MLCDNCGENEATVRYTEIINGNKREMKLCEECSRKLGINNMDLRLPIDFSSFFGDLISEYEQSDLLPMFNTTSRELKCDTCNTTYKEFLDTGKFGCADCYTAFQDRINSVLKRIQGSTEYLGRKSLNTGKTEEKNCKEKTKTQKQEKPKLNLEDELKLAIKEERYEDAAKIRDEIKKQENNKKGE